MTENANLNEADSLIIAAAFFDNVRSEKIPDELFRLGAVQLWVQLEHVCAFIAQSKLFQGKDQSRVQ